MAVVGIVMKFFQIVISIVVGMAAGCIPVVGFNMGAKKPDRVKELFTRLLLAEAAVGVVALVLVECFPRQLIALFGAANESVYYTDFAVKSFRIYLCMIILACVNKACFIFLQAMGKAADSTALSMNLLQIPKNSSKFFERSREHENLQKNHERTGCSRKDRPCDPHRILRFWHKKASVSECQ